MTVLRIKEKMGEMGIEKELEGSRLGKNTK